MQQAFGRDFDLGDRDVVLQMAVDAKAIGADEVAQGFADCVRFPELDPAAVRRVRPRLSWMVRQQVRVPYEIKRVWREEDHPRHPTGSPARAGGEFALKPLSARTPQRARQAPKQTRLARLRVALAKRRDLSGREREIYARIAEEEGVEGKDPGSTAFAGILQGTPEDAQRRSPSLRRFGTPSALTDDAIITVYKDHLDDVMQSVGGSRAIDEIGSDCAAAAFMDTLFRHGRGDGAKLLQEAIADTWSEAFPNSTSPLIDRGLGPSTFEAFKALVRNGFGPQLTRDLAKLRGKAKPSESGRYSRFVCTD